MVTICGPLLFQRVWEKKVMDYPYPSYHVCDPLLPSRYYWEYARAKRGVSSHRYFHLYDFCDNLLRYRCWQLGCWDTSHGTRRVCLYLLECRSEDWDLYLNFHVHRLALSRFLQHIPTHHSLDRAIPATTHIHQGVELFSTGSHYLNCILCVRKASRQDFGGPRRTSLLAISSLYHPERCSEEP